LYRDERLPSALGKKQLGEIKTNTGPNKKYKEERD
jgi:hypothetical protein